MASKLLQVPYGTRDILPENMRLKRKIENNIAETFTKWGYSEVQTPTFEYLDTFSASGDISESNFKFLDRNNNILMLRTDMTTPIARLVATRLDATNVNRLSYRAQLFRYEEAQVGRQCEFTQAGIEMMGGAGAAADAEVLALAVNALLEAGLKDFTISMGQINFIEGLTEQAKLTAAQAETVKQYLITKNVVGLEEVINENNIDESLTDIFKELLFLHGGEELLAKMRQKNLNKKSLAAIENLQEIYDLLKIYGIEKYITFDLGLIRDMEYYTGMLFEGFTAHMGYSIIGGGRYDSMMTSFGKPLPATGFAIGIERIMLALERLEDAKKILEFDVYLGYAEEKLAAAINKCNELRAAGKTVCMAVAPESKELAKETQTKQKCRNFEYME